MIWMVIIVSVFVGKYVWCVVCHFDGLLLVFLYVWYACVCGFCLYS